MIFGIGTDIVEIERIERSISKNKAFASRILSPTELSEFIDRSSPASFLAKRFAAKEALVKAMGTGIGNGISWQMCEVLHNSLGRPNFKVSGAIQAFFETHKLECFLSISDEKKYATATVILEINS